MPLHRRFTARKALFTLTVWLFIALIVHLKSELWDPAPAPTQQLQKPTEPLGNDDDDDYPRRPDEDDVQVGGGSGNANPRTTVVVASQKSENASWLGEFFPEWEKHIYSVDDPGSELTVPQNKGRESMVYLTFIIDNYADLPDHVLFVHPNRYQWHNDDPDYDGLPMLRHFQIPYLEQEGYVNIRCAWSLGCPMEIKPLEEEGEHRAAVHAGGDYKKAFEVLFPGQEVPKRVGVSCCAQFAATKKKITERPLSDYVAYREWLLGTKLDDSISGRVMEYSWHMIFGKEPVHCPSAKDCYCKVFGLCNLDCSEQGSCSGRYTLPPYSVLPEGWPNVGWDNKERQRAGPEA